MAISHKLLYVINMVLDHMHDIVQQDVYEIGGNSDSKVFHEHNGIIGTELVMFAVGMLMLEMVVHEDFIALGIVH